MSSPTYAAIHQTEGEHITRIEYAPYSNMYFAVTQHTKLGEWVVPIQKGSQFDLSVYNKLSNDYIGQPITIRYDDNNALNCDYWEVLSYVIGDN
jgi:hypothetical protein